MGSQPAYKNDCMGSGLSPVTISVGHHCPFAEREGDDESTGSGDGFRDRYV